MRNLSKTAMPSGSWSSGLRSVARTLAPSRTSNSADAIPDFFMPTTRALVPFNSMSSQLKRAEREQRQDQTRNPEARNNFRLRPPDLLEMMMQGRHLENPLSPQLETSD